MAPILSLFDLCSFGYFSYFFGFCSTLGFSSGLGGLDIDNLGFCWVEGGALSPDRFLKLDLNLFPTILGDPLGEFF